MINLTTNRIESISIPPSTAWLLGEFPPVCSMSMYIAPLGVYDVGAVGITEKK